MIITIYFLLLKTFTFLNKNKNEETENSHNNNVQYETTQMITNIRLGISDFDNNLRKQVKIIFQ